MEKKSAVQLGGYLDSEALEFLSKFYGGEMFTLADALAGGEPNHLDVLEYLIQQGCIDVSGNHSTFVRDITDIDPEGNLLRISRYGRWAVEDWREREYNREDRIRERNIATGRWLVTTTIAVIALIHTLFS